MAETHTDRQTRQKNQRALRTISEASELIDVPQHVLRFWETKFPQIRPLKRNGGRRFYRPEDIDNLLTIKYLLYKQGYTIKGAKKAFEQKQVDEITAGFSDVGNGKAAEASNDNGRASIINEVTPPAHSEGELQDVISNLKNLSKALRD